MPAQGGNVVRAILLIVAFALAQSSIAYAVNEKDKAKPKPKISTFLARCKADLETCTQKISDVSLEMVSNVSDQSWCPTAETDDVKIVTPKTVDWLSAHPELAAKPIDEGIKTALRGLYPCKR
jgi:Ssp1 endopeptidase immunity protein Rap1a